MRKSPNPLSLLAVIGSAFLSGLVQASDKVLVEVTVVGTSVITQHGESQSATQTVTDRDIAKANLNSLSEYMDQQMSGVSVNHAQNNPLQADVQFRGFSASPLLGISQGIAVYQNGMRINEPFGDTVNWDLIADNTVANLSLVTGSNPVFGLNALGGALVINTKNGFDNQAKEISLSAGSFSRKTASVNIGDNDGRFGYHIAANGFDEDGWRDFSKSTAVNLYTALSWRFDRSKVDLYYNHADTELRGNGPAPVDMLVTDRAAVFTNPDITENNLDMVNLAYQRDLSESRKLNLILFVRKNNTDSFNGDGTNFIACDGDSEYAGFLCVGDDDDDDSSSSRFAEVEDDELVLAMDKSANPLTDNFDAINNLSKRKQQSYGFNIQLSEVFEQGAIRHNLIGGINYLKGKTRFDSVVEFAELTDALSTTRSGLFDAQGDTRLTSQSKAFGAYLTDTMKLNDKLNVTVSARYDTVDIKSADRTGKQADLNARHNYHRLNLGISGLYRFTDDIHGYVSLGQSMRAPSPVELACSHPDDPCTLPNTFLADPPLDEVISTSYEVGLRGGDQSMLIDQWHVGIFHTVNENDILFQSTGGVSSNVGYFDNVADTLRQGLELRAKGKIDPFSWSLNYTYLKATFEDRFIASSPNHPKQKDGGVEVQVGSQIPGLPLHNLSLGLDYHFNDEITVGVTAETNSGLYLRGDEANLDSKTDDYVVFGLNVGYQPGVKLSIDLSVQNLFDKEYESFGLFGEPDEVFEEFTNPRFLSAAAPRGAWVKFRYRW